jgi:uncharacterized protein HemX
MFTVFSVIGGFFMKSPIGQFLSKYLIYILLFIAVGLGIYYGIKHYNKMISDKAVLTVQVKEQLRINEQLNKELQNNIKSNEITVSTITDLNKEVDELKKKTSVSKEKVITKVKVIHANPDLSESEKDMQISEVYIDDLNSLYYEYSKEGSK